MFCSDFNTSYVIFYLIFILLRQEGLLYFNTSYVIFYRKGYGLGAGQVLISIHPMLFFIWPCGRCTLVENRISIHPMLFFIWGCLTERFYKIWVQISIHPMLFFIESLIRYCQNKLTFQYILCYFLSGVWWLRKSPQGVFQYILCYFLSLNNDLSAKQPNNFNTSYVIFYPIPI